MRTLTLSLHEWRLLWLLLDWRIAGEDPKRFTFDTADQKQLEEIREKVSQHVRREGGVF